MGYALFPELGRALGTNLSLKNYDFSHESGLKVSVEIACR
jgi:hypothetical protein